MDGGQTQKTNKKKKKRNVNIPGSPRSWGTALANLTGPLPPSIKYSTTVWSSCSMDFATIK